MYDTLIAFHTLELIQESLNKICLRFSGISCSDDFLMSESGMMKLDSICMKLTAIGESIKNLDKVTNRELLIQYPEIPWKHVMGIRDIIVHHYFDVDADEIYRICQEDIPQLHRVITRMMDDAATVLSARFFVPWSVCRQVVPVRPDRLRNTLRCCGR